MTDKKGLWHTLMSPFIDPMVDILEEIKCSHYSIDESEDMTITFGPSKSKVQMFRPQNFAQYIGQEKTKTRLLERIEFCKERSQTLPHILISGEAGCGKTTLAKIIANTLGKTFKEVMTASIVNPLELLMAIREVDGGVLFLDEIHGIPRYMAETIYSIMEDFQYNGQSISPFTLIGATTELGEMIADRKPFVDRFKMILQLEDYTIEELSVISRQYRLTIYPQDHLDFNLHKELAKNCRATPRNLLRLTEELVVTKGDLKKVLYNLNIIKDGYTCTDLQVLKYVSLNDKGVGLQGLVAYLGTSSQNYLYNIEPFLVKNQLILRTPRGRKISDLGKLKIEELEKEIK